MSCWPADLTSIARAIIDANLYMVIGTADEHGRPWASPVYYAPAAYREFFWVSRPEARHSRNLEVRSQLGIVIFDSSAAIGTGQGVYMSAVADQLAGPDAEEGIEIFSTARWRTADTRGRRATSSRRRSSASTERSRRRPTFSTRTTGACP